MKKSYWSVLMLALFAIVGLSTPLSACPSGGCGGTGATAGCPNGGCPSGGCPNDNKLKRAPAQQPNGGGRAPVAADPKGVPSWQTVSTEAIESAAAEERPIIVYFPSENANDSEFYGEELAELSKADALFIKMPYTADREASPWAEESVVPTSKLLSDNPARDFNVAGGKATVLVCDWYGNECFRTDVKIKADKLSAMIGKVKEQVDDANEKLQKNLDKAQEYVDASDRKNAIKYLLKNFKDGLVGLSAQEDTIRLYHQVMDDARAEVAKLTEAKDSEALKALAKEFKKTDVEKDIDEALSKLS
ncbi:MAG: hypothetical protein H6839_10225 [Planctomycetes bacterium]|nr:hypothetical protein [Planctomycetota bacterium]